MKLNNKFALIVAITAIQILALAGFLTFGSREMIKIKDYQFVQSTLATELSDLIVFTDEVDNWGCQPSTAYREWNERLTAIEKDFYFLQNSPIASKFGDEFQQSQSELNTLWNMLKTRAKPIEGILKEMQDLKVPLGVTTHTASNGIRFAYTQLPDNQYAIALMSLVEQLHNEMKGVKRSYQSIKKINNRTSQISSEYLEKSQRIFLITGSIFAVLSCFILSFLIAFVTTGITKRIKKIRDMTSVLAKKDFTTEIVPEGSEEIYSLMTNINDMVQQINDFFIVVKSTAAKAISSGYSINDAANSTAAATSEIDNNISDITNDFANINDYVRSAVAAITEMNSHVETLVTNNEKQFISVKESNNAVLQVVETLKYINSMTIDRTKNAEEMHDLVVTGDEKIAVTNNLLHQITDQLEEIKEVVTIIDNVAEQTNLLSMNAAIESAHAGEAGKGFSVVAEEIRSLAESTSENASKIAKVISEIVNSVSSCNAASEEAAEAFYNVSKHSDKVIESFREISSGIGTIDEQISQIKVKTEETSIVANQINAYCQNLADKQKIVSTEVDSMNSKFERAMESIHQIKNGTEDIVGRMKHVSDSSKQSYKNMTDLENILEEFKTNADQDQAVRNVNEDNVITNVVSQELMNFDTPSPVSGEIEFDLDNVDEY